jgi:hypothetical protein
MCLQSLLAGPYVPVFDDSSDQHWLGSAESKSAWSTAPTVYTWNTLVCRIAQESMHSCTTIAPQGTWRVGVANGLLLLLPPMLLFMLFRRCQ